MSRGLRVELSTPPSGARLIAGTAVDYLARLSKEREDRAYARGRADGAADAASTSGRALEKACAALEAARAESLDAVARDTVELAIAIAEEIVRVEVGLDRHAIERIVREALAATGVGRGPCVIHVNPRDAARLASTSFRTGTTVEADPDVAAGDCHITTPRGLCVREIESLLVTIAERLREETA